MTKKGVLLALTNATEGDDDAFNDWYDNAHLVDVLKIPGFVRAKRYRLSSAQRSDGPFPYRYMALYDIETGGEIMDVVQELVRRTGTDAMPLSPTLQEHRLAWYFELIHEAEQQAE